MQFGAISRFRSRRSATTCLGCLPRVILPACEKIRVGKREGEGKYLMNWKSKLILGVLTALAMMVLTYALPRGGAMRDAALVQFPVTVGVWAIFVLLFVKLK
jgi:hypothetical protein